MSRGKYVVDKIHDYVMDNDEDLYLDFDDYRELDEYVQGLQPVIHARWIPVDNKYKKFKCSNCNYCLKIPENSKAASFNYHFCSFCGADMRENVNGMELS